VAKDTPLMPGATCRGGWIRVGTSDTGCGPLDPPTWYTPGGSSLMTVKSLPVRCRGCRVDQLSKEPSTSTCSPP